MKFTFEVLALVSFTRAENVQLLKKLDELEHRLDKVQDNVVNMGGHDSVPYPCYEWNGVQWVGTAPKNPAFTICGRENCDKCPHCF